MASIIFGDCLNTLLSILNISANRLSKAINVDSSLVNRWLNGKRVPGYRTIYIDSIAEYLSKNILNSFQHQRLDEFFFSVYESEEITDNQKEKITKVLLEAQGYSMECRRREKIESKKLPGNKDQIPVFPINDQSCILRQNNINDEKLVLDKNELIHSVALSSQDKIIFKTQNVLSEAISLLELAADQFGCNKTIYLTYNNDVDIANLPCRDFADCFRTLLLKAINNGWNVLFLLRLNNNIHRTIGLINFVKPLIKTGKFNPYYINKYDTSAPGKENITVPEIGVLSCFSTKPNSEIDCAFYFKNEIAIDVFKDYYQVFLSNYAQPLIRYYSHEDKLAYSHCLTQSEENIGNRFLYKYCFSLLTLPENLYIKLLKRKALSNDEILTELMFYKRRSYAFLSNMLNYQYYDIYFTDSIKDLIRHRRCYFYSYTGIELIDLEVQDIIEHLQHIITLLKNYNNYNIAFITKNTRLEGTISDDYHYCVVKERQAVLLEVYEPAKDEPEVRLSITEPMLVKAFEEYFKEIWEQIAPINKNKKEVIEWLQSQIDLLQQ